MEGASVAFFFLPLLTVVGSSFDFLLLHILNQLLSVLAELFC